MLKCVKVVCCNIEFWNLLLIDYEIDVLVKENIKCIGMVLFEIVMGWWWLLWWVRCVIEIEGYEYVEVVLERGKGVFGMVLYNMNLEFVCCGIGYFYFSIVFYCKYNNFLMDYL